MKQEEELANQANWRVLLALSALIAGAAVMLACTGNGGTSSAGLAQPVFSNYHLTGATAPVHDPSIFRQGETYYVFGTDVGAPLSGSLPIRCSTDRVSWIQCGYVFTQVPTWVTIDVPGIVGLWAPDISYFGGVYHAYYAGSTFGSNTSVIGLATNVTLDASDPNYEWIDRGKVLGSTFTDDFNAIDPTILADTDGRVWMTYGSFWTGIKQREINPATGMLLASNPTIYSLAERPAVQFDPIEGTSLVHKGNFYYLFASFDFCCKPNPYDDTYRIVVGRATSPNGPFADMNGSPMMQGGGTELLAGNRETYSGPGGETVYLDSQNGDLIVFHAIHLPDGQAYLFVNPLTWSNDWPQIQP